MCQSFSILKAQRNRHGVGVRADGSTRYATLPVAAQALTGRAHRVEILPLSQGEIAEVREDFTEILVGEPASLVGPRLPAIVRDEYVSRVIAGGFPLALRRATSADRARWFDDYVNLVIERDVLELSRVRQRRALPLLLRQLASRTGQVLNIAKAASAIGMEKSMARTTPSCWRPFSLYTSSRPGARHSAPASPRRQRSTSSTADLPRDCCA